MGATLRLEGAVRTPASQAGTAGDFTPKNQNYLLPPKMTRDSSRKGCLLTPAPEVAPKDMS